MERKLLLVDSSWWLSEMRAGRDPTQTLSLVSHLHDPAICGVVRCEVARGIKAPAVLARFRRFWEVMVSVPTDDRLWAEVEDLLWMLDREGSQIPLADAVIAACALRIGAVVVTLDAHFALVPGLEVVSSPREVR